MRDFIKVLNEAHHVNLWVEIIKRRSASGSSFMSVTNFQVDLLFFVVVSFLLNQYRGSPSDYNLRHLGEHVEKLERLRSFSIWR